MRQLAADEIASRATRVDGEQVVVDYTVRTDKGRLTPRFQVENVTFDFAHVTREELMVLAAKSYVIRPAVSFR